MFLHRFASSSLTIRICKQRIKTYLSDFNFLFFLQQKPTTCNPVRHNASLDFLPQIIVSFNLFCPSQTSGNAAELQITQLNMI